MREQSYQVSGKAGVARDGLVHLCLELHSRSLYCSLVQEDNLILLFQKAPVLYMTLAGSRLPSGINKQRYKEKCHFKATFRRPLSVSREMNSRHSQTRECSFSLSQEVWLAVVFKSVHFTVLFFFLAKKKIGIYILTTEMLLSKTPSQKHDKHKHKYISCHDRARSH